eukprot:4613889-Prymnesium_polylepis.1
MAARQRHCMRDEDACDSTDCSAPRARRGDHTAHACGPGPARHVPRGICDLAGEEDMVGYGGIWGI